MPNIVKWNESVKPLRYDFAQLAARYPQLAESSLVRSCEEYQYSHHPAGSQYDFTNHQGLVALTTAILHHYHGVKVELSLEHLCPRVPNRYIYVKWVEKLLPFIVPRNRQVQETTGKGVSVVDIGTGSSAIYALLGASVNPHWRFVGTECNQGSFELAERNVMLNPGLSQRIGLARNNNSSKVLDFEALRGVEGGIADSELVITICNPPFFDTDEKESSSHIKKIQNTQLVASDSELFFPGGEVAFIKKMIVESVENNSNSAETSGKSEKNKFWHSSMVGRFGSLKSVVKELRKQNITNFGIFEINPGYHCANKSQGHNQGRTKNQNPYLSHLTEQHLEDPEEGEDESVIQTGSKPQSDMHNAQYTENAEQVYQKSNKPIVRWIVFWSFSGYHVPDFLGHQYKATYRSLNGLQTTFKIDLKKQSSGKETALQKLNNNVLQKLRHESLTTETVEMHYGKGAPLGTAANENYNSVTVEVPGDVWSRAYRRKVKRIQEEESKVATKVDTEELELSNQGVVTKRKKISVEGSQYRNGHKNDTAFKSSTLIQFGENERCVFQLIYDDVRKQIIVFWSYGTNEKTFESFCGYIKRSAQEAS